MNILFDKLELDKMKMSLVNHTWDIEQSLSQFWSFSIYMSPFFIVIQETLLAFWYEKCFILSAQENFFRHLFVFL